MNRCILAPGYHWFADTSLHKVTSFQTWLISNLYKPKRFLLSSTLPSPLLLNRDHRQSNDTCQHLAEGDADLPVTCREGVGRAPPFPRCRATALTELKLWALPGDKVQGPNLSGHTLGQSRDLCHVSITIALGTQGQCSREQSPVQQEAGLGLDTGLEAIEGPCPQQEGQTLSPVHSLLLLPSSGYEYPSWSLSPTVPSTPIKSLQGKILWPLDL